MEKIETLLAIAAYRVGRVREETGQNDGEAVETYLAEVGLGPGYEWCAAFLVWCFRKAGYTVGPMALARQWFSVARRRIHPDGVRPGDVRGIPNVHGQARHIGLVESVDHEAGTCVTIEGNTANAVRRVNHQLEGGIYARWT